MNELLIFLNNKYPIKEFTFEELLAKAPYKKSKLYNLLNDLIKANKVVRIARGVYELKKARDIPPPLEITNLSNKLKKTITRKFKFTGSSVLLPLIHHTPYSIVYLLYVEKGSADDFKEAISKIDPKIAILVCPKKEDILLLINEAKKNKILVIKENAFFYGKEYGIAYHDTAFVDLYFEVTRNKLPFMKSDLIVILKDLISNDMLNYSRIMRYAHERKLTTEVKSILLKLSKEVKMPKSGLNVLRKISQL